MLVSFVSSGSFTKLFIRVTNLGTVSSVLSVAVWKIMYELMLNSQLTIEQSQMVASARDTEKVIPEKTVSLVGYIKITEWKAVFFFPQRRWLIQPINAHKRNSWCVLYKPQGTGFLMTRMFSY